MKTNTDFNFVSGDGKVKCVLEKTKNARMSWIIYARRSIFVVMW